MHPQLEIGREANHAPGSSSPELIPSVVQVLASINEPGAGPSYSVRGLVDGLIEHGVDVRIRTVAGWRPGQSSVVLPSCRAPILEAPMGRVFGRILCASSSLHQALRRDAIEAHILHTHGLWLMPNVYPSWAVRERNARAHVVVSPRGMLGAAALAFSPKKKQLFWTLLQRSAMNSVALLHATSEAEYEDIRAFGLATPVAIIPNGVDLPCALPLVERSPRTLLYLGRLHPKKGLEGLLRAWAALESRRADWTLRIVGPAENGHDHELRALAIELGLRQISVEGALYGEAKFQAYHDADIFVMPTLHENFAMTVAEALAAGTPVISTKGAPWSGLIVEHCGWWIDHGVAALEAALDLATMASREDLYTMGERGRAWMERDFGWSRVGGEMAAAYRWLIEGGSPPPTLRFD